jgi:hypothetical protein
VLVYILEAFLGLHQLVFRVAHPLTEVVHVPFPAANVVAADLLEVIVALLLLFHRRAEVLFFADQVIHVLFRGQLFLLPSRLRLTALRFETFQVRRRQVVLRSPVVQRQSIDIP